MRAALLRLLSLSLVFSSLAWAADPGIPEDWIDPFSATFEAIEPARLESQRFELSNGMVVFLLEDHDLPLIEGVVYVRAPSVFDPEDQAGLAAMTANLLRGGGAAGLSADAIDEQLEFLAASIESSASDAFASLSFSALSDTIDDVLPLFADILRQPDFDEARLEIERGQQLEAIRRQNDNPVQIAAREFFARIAQGHPSGYYPTEATINAISRDDLVDFHQRFFAPNVSYLAVSGDFDSADMLAQLEAIFADWPARELVQPELPAFNPEPEPLIFFAPRETAQSVVVMGHPSVYAYSDAYNVLRVANGILGGEGFSSRIVNEVRTRRGLAYSTASALSQGFDTPGLFYAFSFSRGDATGEVIEALLEQISVFRQEGVSASELERQQNIILNRAVFRFASSRDVVQRDARAELWGLEPDYYETHIERVQALTTEDILRVAQQELHPERMMMVVVGDPDSFDRPLEDFGEVVTIELP